MAAKRCSTCGINWPLNVDKCPKCGDGTWPLKEGYPDEDARAKPPVDIRLWVQPDYPSISLIAKAHIVWPENPGSGGQAWITDAVLWDAGYTMVGVNTVVKVQGEAGIVWFEISGRARQKGVGELAGWWLQRIPTESEMFADLPVIEGTDPDGAAT